MKESDKQIKTNTPFKYNFNKDFFEEFPAMKWVVILLVIFLLVYLSKFVFNAIAGSVNEYKNMKAAFDK